jgi:hypothetical protein
LNTWDIDEAKEFIAIQNDAIAKQTKYIKSRFKHREENPILSNRVAGREIVQNKKKVKKNG